MNTKMTDILHDSEQISEILIGAYDLHTHSSPSAFPRALDDLQLVREADEAGMAGVMIKSHYGSTADRATIVNVGSGCSAKALGGLVLNHPVGGLNPYAVENALHQGACVIWMPTRDSKHCLSFGDMEGDFFERPGIGIFDENGKIVSNVYEAMALIKKYGAYLATGHLSLPESLQLCKEAARLRVNTILTHPEWNRTKVPVDIQKELASMGTLVEKSWINVAEGSVTIEEIAHNIREVGTENVYLTTDRGQQGYEHPVDGMKMFLQNLINQGFRQEELITMCRHVPAYIACGQSR